MSRGKRTRSAPLPPKLTRRIATREPKLALIVFCEGGNTEPDYLNELVSEWGNSLVRIKVIGAAGVPSTLVAKALEMKKSIKGKQDGFARADQIWVVFDCDDHDHVKTSIHNAHTNGIRVAYSNPCFELWAYLHLADHDAPIDQHAMQKLLAERMKGYLPGKSKRLNYEYLRGNAEIAEKRAESMAQRREAERAPLGNPYTGVYELVRLIRQNGRG